MTTLRGGTLGYAEIVALKVKPPPPRKARHTSRCRDPDGRPPLLLPSPPPRLLVAAQLFIPNETIPLFPLVIPSSHHYHRHRRRRFFSLLLFHPATYRPPSPKLPLSTVLVITTCLSVLCPTCGSPRVVAYRARCATECRISVLVVRSLASRCLVRCFRCSVSLVGLFETRRGVGARSS